MNFLPDSDSWCSCLQMLLKSAVGMTIRDEYWVSGICSCSDSNWIKFRLNDADWTRFFRIGIFGQKIERQNQIVPLWSFWPLMPGFGVSGPMKRGRVFGV